jgi:hypothetical protein
MEQSHGVKWVYLDAVTQCANGAALYSVPEACILIQLLFLIHQASAKKGQDPPQFGQIADLN